MPDLSENSPDAYLARLKSGAVLVAREPLTDPNFSNTIVLLCQYHKDGAYGLVLNRPAHMPLHEIFEHPPEMAGEAGKTRRIYIGGPVQSTELQILQIGSDPVTESLEIVPGIHLGGAWAQLEDFLGRDPRSLRLFLGYSGWGDGQLEEEIAAGAWEVWEPDLSRLLAAPDEAWAGGRDAFHGFLKAL
jgi:putative transcriptional regulator